MRFLKAEHQSEPEYPPFHQLVCCNKVMLFLIACDHYFLTVYFSKNLFHLYCEACCMRCNYILFCDILLRYMCCFLLNFLLCSIIFLNLETQKIQYDFVDWIDSYFWIIVVVI